MVEFTSEALDLKIGDIVLERQLNNDEYYWVVYKVDDKPVYGTNRKGYYAFLLSEPERTIGPIVFRSTNAWEYKVIRYD